MDNFAAYITDKLAIGNVYLVFDRYENFRTKCVTRSGGATGASRVHQLRLSTPLPSQVILTVTENKRQLIDDICSQLIRDETFHSNHTHQYKLVVANNVAPGQPQCGTGKDGAPIEISHGGVVIIREDMAISHEEGNNITVQRLVVQ